MNLRLCRYPDPFRTEQTWDKVGCLLLHFVTELTFSFFRNALADAQLHLRVAEMSSHIQKLEDALRISHSYHSSTQHPLLSEELLQIKRGITRDSGPLGPVPTLSDEQYIELFGTLTVNERGSERFLGASGTTEVGFVLRGVLSITDVLAESSTGMVSYLAATSSHHYLQTEVGHEMNSHPHRQHPPAKKAILQLSEASRHWISHVSDFREDEAQLLQVIAAHLPSRERASTLCEAYLTNLSWFCRPVDREQLIDELVPVLYEKLVDAPAHSLMGGRGVVVNDNGSVSSDEWDLDEEVDMDLHEVALVLSAFACGAAADFSHNVWHQTGMTAFLFLRYKNAKKEPCSQRTKPPAENRHDRS